MPTGVVKVRVTYSDSCHLRHAQKIVRQPRALLKLIPGLELVELRQPDRCCGSAGVYNIVHSETADQVLDTKMADIKATGADVIVASNTGCHMQLIAGVRRAGMNANGQNVRVMHVVELLDMSYGQRGQWAPRCPVIAGDRGACRRLFPPEQVVTDPVALLTYESDASLDRGKPDAAVFPRSTADVVRRSQWAAEAGSAADCARAQAPGCRAARWPSRAASSWSSRA